MNIPWNYLAPELVLIVAAAVILLVDLLLKKDQSRFAISVLTLIALAVSGYYLIISLHIEQMGILYDTYSINRFSQLAKMILLLGTALVVILSSSFSEERKYAKGEFYVLLLTATLGAMVVSSSYDLITLYVGLELLGLSSYILVGIQKDRLSANEASWKYVVYGGASSAFFLYGVSFLYGLTGSTNIQEMVTPMLEALQMGYAPYLYLSFFLIIVAIGFKLAMAPFHMWAPDVYQGSSGSVVTFVTVISKVAAFLLAFRVLFISFEPLGRMDGSRILELAFFLITGLSMLWGILVALRQTNVKRMLAYSSIAHSGYMFVSLMGSLHWYSLFFYLITYTFMTAGALAVVSIVENKEKNVELDAFTGLANRSPALALAMTLFMISMAGIPLTAGFFGKFYVLVGALSREYFILVGILLLSTVISYAVYFRVIRQMYFSGKEKQPERNIPIPFGAGVVILISFVATLALGVVPELLLKYLQILT